MTSHQTYCRGRQAGKGGHNRCGQVWSGVSQQALGAGRQVDAGQDTGMGRCEHRGVGTGQRDTAVGRLQA